MRAYLAKLSPRAWALVALLLTVIAYPVLTMLLPAAI
jgi:hypothetical protein